MKEIRTGGDMETEGELVEFKRAWSKAALKTVVAFANARGGALYVGIEDDGSVCGVDDADAVMCTATAAIRDAIRPDASMIARCECLKVRGKQVVGIRVERGASRPYYLAAKGMRPEGVYVRQGAASFMASEREIADMVKQARGESFEDGRSIQQDLSFCSLERAFRGEGLALGDAQMRTLGLVDAYGQFTNAGWLLSDQCEASIKLATFFGTTRVTIKGRAETHGSLLDQIDQAFDFLSEHTHYKTVFENMRRVDREDFPPDALREAVINAVAHRDYEEPAATLISVLEDRVEIVSHGGLPHGYELAEFQMDVSVPRNPKLAAVLYRLKLIEAYGTGIARMFEAYEGSGVVPRIDITKHLFKVTLPNRNAVAAMAGARGDSGAGDSIVMGDATLPSRVHDGSTASAEGAGGVCVEAATGARIADVKASLRDQERIVLTMLEDQGPLKRRELQERFDFSQATLLRILKRLEERGLIRAEGNTCRRVYHVVG